MPILSVSGAQGVGKTTFIKDFLAQWPMYSTPTFTYRDIIKERGLDINKETCKETQKIILDSICKTLNKCKRTDNIIFDRNPLDNLVYTLWASEKGVGDFDEAFVAECIKISREAIKKFDIMFMIPVTKYNRVEDIKETKETRETDPIYQEEINELFMGLKRFRDEGNDVFFDRDDCAPVIEIFGNPQERIAMTSLYLREDGNIYGEEDSLLVDASGEYMATDGETNIDTGERDMLRRQFGLEETSNVKGYKGNIVDFPFGINK